MPEVSPARPRWNRVRIGILALFGLAMILTSCASTGATGSGPSASDTVSGTITVFAAASLKEAFTEMAQSFEAANPTTTVELNFAGSSILAGQIIEGAPADVFASADEANMAKVTDAGALVGAPTTFATNGLEMIVAPGNPKGIHTLADLARSDLVYVTAAQEVPVGAYAARMLERAGTTADPSSYETDVKAIVTKVTSGEADVGIVYATDVAAAGTAAEGVAVPADVDIRVSYPIGVVADSGNEAGAHAWVRFVTGAAGQRILAGYGFGPP